ncbi:uncharacterized protein LOC130242102 [Danio aesculapii]|uniref:uncharacterized protein LOC130242102 n=1 Tax=Danio aesculapii TaxID=1142201 RepID=UPI0024C020B1|nr:uncharacterized protein LOC130242102 [Danio aesculapii]
MNLAEQHVLFLNGEAYVEFDVKESYRRNQLLQAILDSGKEGDSLGFDSVEIKMRTLELSVEGNVSDGQWLFFICAEEAPFSLCFWMIASDIPEIIQNLGFRGCVEYIKYNGHLLSFNGHNDIVESSSSLSAFQTFCVSPIYCVLTPCLEDSCLSEPCWNNSDCGSSSRDDYWCICLPSESSCGSCSSDLIHSDPCSPTKKTAPLWIVAVVIPIALILLILVLCFVLRRHQNHSEVEKKSHIYLMPPNKPHGMDNLAFSLSPAEMPNISNEPNKQPDLIKPRDSTQGVERFTESGPLCHVSGFAGSELEYYEIDSTYSDVMKTEDEQANAKVPQSTMQPQNNHKPSPKLHLKTPGGDFHQWQHQSHLFFKRKLAPDLTGPPQYLSADEVEKLNTPRDGKRHLNQN